MIMHEQRRGMMFVLSSPSGAGKTTLSRKLLTKQQSEQAANPSIVMSVSVTTRPKRPNEVNGVDYFFVDDTEFSRMVDRGEMLEYAQVFGHSYGTPAAFVEQHLSRGVDVLFDIDWQGTQLLRKKSRIDLASVFILPPSMQELERRLRARAQDSDPVVKHRMSKAAAEISHWEEYDYVLVNDNLEKTLARIEEILKVERLRRERQVWLTDFVKQLG